MEMTQRLLNYQVISRAGEGCLSLPPSFPPFPYSLRPALPWLRHPGPQALSGGTISACGYPKQEQDSSACNFKIQQLLVCLNNLLQVMKRLFFPEPTISIPHGKGWGEGSQPRELSNSIWKERLRAAGEWAILL